MSNDAPSDLHRHDDVDRRQVVAFAHQSRITRRVEEKHRVFDPPDWRSRAVLGVEADQPFVTVYAASSSSAAPLSGALTDKTS